MPSTHGVPPCARVSSVERLCTSRGDLRNRLLFRPKELSGGCSCKREYEARNTYYTLHYNTRCITQTYVFTSRHVSFASLQNGYVDCTSYTACHMWGMLYGGTAGHMIYSGCGTFHGLLDMPESLVASSCPCLRNSLWLCRA